MSELFDLAKNVNGQESLSRFIQDILKSKNEWENSDLDSFLRALAAWIEDMDGYYANTGQAYDERSLSWKNIADMLAASTMYE